MSTFTASVLQHFCNADIQENLDIIAQLINKAAKGGSKLIILQELHNTPYFCQVEDVNNFDLAETIPGPSTEYFSSLARENKVVLVTSLFEKRAPGLFHNTAVVIDADGSVAGKYRKMHIPDDPGFYEKFYFTPGDIGFNPIQTSIGKIGVLICWDQWYPEAARLMALAGAEMLVYPTAIGWDPNDDDHEKQRQLDAWIIAQRAHAVSNGIPVLVANRVGYEPDPSNCSSGIDFWGNSFICGPQGEYIAHANSQNETVLTAEIDLKKSEDVRRIWPFFRDRRIDGFEDLLKRFID
ncbi:MAG: acyltransferase [Gammaproteobacteria bacterium]|nr:MAG: acyltransferase [Gammaproteobacteria bacterium]